MKQTTKVLLGVAGAVCALSLANGWIGVVAGLVSLGWGSLALLMGTETPLSRLYASTQKRFMGIGMLGLGLTFTMCGAVSQSQRELAAEHRQQAEDTAERHKDEQRATNDALAKDLPEKLVHWEKNLQEARSAATANDLTRAQKLVAVEHEAIEQFVQRMEVAPLVLREMSQAYTALDVELNKRVSVERAAKELNAEIGLARASIDAKDWYSAMDHRKRASVLFFDVEKAVPAALTGLPPDTVMRSRADLAKLIEDIGDKAVEPADLTVRQFSAAPPSIREKAVELRWRSAGAEVGQIANMIELARTKNVERDVLSGILHCADGISRKDKEVMKSLGTLINDVDFLRQPKRPASEMIDVCLVTFVAMVVAG